MDQYGNWSSLVFDLNATVGNFTNISWTPSFGEIPNPFDEPSISRRDPDLLWLFHFNNEAAYGEDSDSFFNFNNSAFNGSCVGQRCPVINSTGKLGGSITLNSAQRDVINITGFTNYNASDLFTIMGWIYHHGYAPGNTSMIISKRSSNADGAADFPFQMQVSAASVSVSYSAGDDFSFDASVSSAGGSIQNNTWYHVALTYKANNETRLYLDGVQVGFNNLSFSISNTTTYGWLIGGTNHHSTSPGPANDTAFNGSMDEFAMWRRVLTAQQIGEIYNRTRYGRVRAQVRSCDDAACSGESYVGANNSVNKFFLNNTFSNITFLTDNRYFQYRLYLDVENSTTNITIAPYVDEANFSYDSNFTLSSASTNLTNSSTATAETFNSSVLVTTTGELANITTILFIGGKVNQTVQHLNNYANGITFSFIWNNTNITGGQNLTVQFNASAGTIISSYVNATVVTIVIPNTAPSLVNTTINYTNSTLTVTADSVETNATCSDTDSGDKCNVTIIFYVNNAANQTVQANNNYADGGVVRYHWNNTNITKGQTIKAGFNATDGQAGSVQVNTTAITVNNSAPNAPSTPTLNESNSTLFDNMLINTSAITISDPDAADNLNVTFRWYQGSSAVRNTTFTGLAQTVTPSDVLPASFVVNKGQAMRVEVWVATDDLNSTLVNSTAITINNSNPAWTLTNTTITTTEDNNLASLNISSFLSDRDNDISTLNHTNIAINGTQVATLCSITNGTHLVSCTVQPNSYGFIEFNVTSTIDNDTAPNIGNVSLKSVRIRVNSTDDAPVLQTADFNLTNSSTAASDWINASVDLREVDLNLTNATIRLYVNDVANITLQDLTNRANGTTISIVFNDTNITKGQRIEVQFNGSDGLATNYINTSEITAGNVAPTLLTASLNVTNTTLTTIGDWINFSWTQGEPDGIDRLNFTVIFYVNNVANQTVQLTNDYLNSSAPSYVFNNTNVTKGQNIIVQVNGTDGTAATDYLNTSRITVNNSAPSLSSASVNVTNTTLTRTGDWINFSWTLTESDAADRVNTTVVLFVNDAGNLTYQLLNNYAGGITPSYVFNNTNVTESQTIIVQVNGSDDTIASNYINSSKITTGNLGALLDTASLNVTNTTLTTVGDWINASATISDDTIDRNNVTAVLYVNDVANITFFLGNNYQNGTVLSSVFNNTNVTRGQTVVVQFNASDGDASSNYLNTSKITVNTSAPSLASASLNVTNTTLSVSADFINASVALTENDVADRLNGTAVFYVSDVSNITLNLFNNWQNGQTASIVFNNTNVTADQNVIVQFNFSDGTASSNYLNTSKITVNTSTPLLSSATLNITSSSEPTAEVFNSSISLSDSDGDKINLTAVLFINSAVNQTIQLNNNYGTTASYVWNTTNFTASQTVNVQFNGTDGKVASNYLNTTTVNISALSTVGDVAAGGGVVGSRYAASVDRNFIKLPVKQGASTVTSIQVINTGRSSLAFTVDTGALKKYILPRDDSFALRPGESKTLTFDIFVPENEKPDAYVGRIRFVSPQVTQSVNIVIEVLGKAPLFDIKTDLSIKAVEQAEKLPVSLSIVNKGDLKNIDILLHLSVKDFAGNVYSITEESIAIDEELDITRLLDVPESLAPGRYIVYARITYNDITATATDTFEVLAAPSVEGAAASEIAQIGPVAKSLEEQQRHTRIQLIAFVLTLAVLLLGWYFLKKRDIKRLAKKRRKKKRIPPFNFHGIGK
ncbi:MAG: LamG-like jellyroll fold domain-containing protein [Nanoarchaeota archaeon]